MESASVLLVEDNVELSDNLSEILEGAGYDVRTTAGCQEARAAAQSGFDVALVDVRLPDGDGIELAPTLKALAPQGEIILLTGFATLETAIAAVRAGAWAYLVKPCAPADLLIALEQATRHVSVQKEKEALSQRTHQAEKLAALGTMAAGLAHEIRNPLNAAHLQLKLAERLLGSGRAGELASGLDSLGLVRTELSRLNRIVDDALAFARPANLHATAHDMAGTVTSVARLLAPDIAASGVTLHVVGADQALEASYDEDRIKQVLINLLRNAVDAAGNGGEVWLSVRREGARLELKVEDTGPGVPADVDPFVPYFTTKDRGTGLGLPLAHRIATEHGGTLYLLRGGPRTAFVAEIPAAGPRPA